MIYGVIALVLVVLICPGAFLILRRKRRKKQLPQDIYPLF